MIRARGKWFAPAVAEGAHVIQCSGWKRRSMIAKPRAKDAQGDGD
jgi:hypothetical protein